MKYPNLTIKNSLKDEIYVYDSFQNNAQDKSVSNFFGTLTKLSAVAGLATGTIQPLHGPISVFIIYDKNFQPITRLFTMGDKAKTFEITQAQVDVMTTTQSFLKLLANSPSDSDCVAFKKLTKDGKANAAQINTFFKGTTNYKSCTFITYMLAIVNLACTEATKPKAPEQHLYKLSTLVKHIGFDWPSAIPDFAVADIQFEETNQLLVLGGKLDINNVSFAEGVLGHVLSFLPTHNIDVKVIFLYNKGLATGTTCLEFFMKDIKIPIADGKTFDLDKPTIHLNLNPLFKFVVFEIIADIPFHVFNNPPIDAVATMTIDNLEAAIGVTLKKDTPTTLYTPPVIKGLHFDTFGVGMGLFFEPSELAIGIEGSFHIGDGGQVPLTDDKYAIVCKMEAGVPNPVFLSFNVPKLNLSEVVTLFTNKTCDIDYPVSFSDLSFRWAENPLEPVILPDGSLAPMGYGFSANMNLFGLPFYGDLEIDMKQGVSGEVTMSPMKLGNVLKFSGDGKGVSIKVNAAGTPIPNNAIPKTKKEKKAMTAASTKQIVAPNGPSLKVSTLSSPNFDLDASVSLFELVDEKIEAIVSKNGISFELDYGAVLQTKMKCLLKDISNFSASLSYGMDLKVPLPKIAGISLGSIHLNDSCELDLQISMSASTAKYSVAASFDFQGEKFDVGPFEIDVPISSVSHLLKEVEKYLLAHVADIFKDFIGDAGKWLGAVGKKLIEGVTEVAGALKNAFGKPAKEVAAMMKGAGYAMADIGSQLSKAFGGSATVVASALKDGAQATADEVSSAMESAGFATAVTAKAMASVFKSAGIDKAAEAAAAETKREAAAAAAATKKAADAAAAEAKREAAAAAAAAAAATKKAAEAAAAETKREAAAAAAAAKKIADAAAAAAETKREAAAAAAATKKAAEAAAAETKREAAAAAAAAKKIADAAAAEAKKAAEAAAAPVTTTYHKAKKFFHHFGW